MRFYLHVDDSLKRLRSAEINTGSLHEYSLLEEKQRLVEHLNAFEREMRRKLKPFSLELFAMGKGKWARYFSEQGIRAASFHPTDDNNDLHSVVIPVTPFGVSISNWRHELAHVLIRQMQKERELENLPLWLEEGFCELTAASQNRFLPLEYLRGFQSLYRHRPALSQQVGAGKAVSPAECESVLALPSVGYLFYLFLLRERTNSHASAVDDLRRVVEGIKNWTKEDLATEFQRFLTSLRLDKVVPTIEFALSKWVRSGKINAWELENLLLFMPRSMVAPGLLERIANKSVENAEIQAEIRSAVRLTLFQSWWNRRFELDNVHDDTGQASTASPLGRLSGLLDELKREGLGTKRRNLLQEELGWLIYLVYPFGIKREDIFQIHKMAMSAIADPETDPRSTLNLICSAYPILTPRWGLSPWSGSLPVAVRDWLLLHLPNMKDHVLQPPRLSILQEMRVLPSFEPSPDGWLQHLLQRHQIRIKKGDGESTGTNRLGVENESVIRGGPIQSPQPRTLR